MAIYEYICAAKPSHPRYAHIDQSKLYRPNELPANSALLNVRLLTTSETKRLHPRWNAVICLRAALLVVPPVALEETLASCRKRIGGNGFLQLRTGHLLFSASTRRHCKQTTWSHGSFCRRTSFAFKQPGAWQMADLYEVVMVQTLSLNEPYYRQHTRNYY